MLFRFVNLLRMVLPSSLAAHAVSEFLTQWWVVAAERQCFEDILDGAENWSTSLPTAPPTDILVPYSIKKNNKEEKGKGALKTTTEAAGLTNLFPKAPEYLPADAAVHILSFLHPKDVLAFGCASTEARKVVEEDAPVWKTLWYRDYAWLTTSWKVGREAAKRSFQSRSALGDQEPEEPRDMSSGSSQMSMSDADLTRQLGTFRFGKEFYFRFGLSFVDYVLAGQCTSDSCLVGIAGHIYDLTAFLEVHPGSPETVIAHAGKDCTGVFESMRHTVGARKLAQQMCVAVDLSRSGGEGFGVRPTTRLCSNEQSCRSTVNAVKPNGRPQVPITATSDAVRTEFLREQGKSALQARRMKEAGNVNDALSDFNAYYDPFCKKWKAWYLGGTSEPVFVEDIVVPSSTSFFF